MDTIGAYLCACFDRDFATEYRFASFVKRAHDICFADTREREREKNIKNVISLKQWDSLLSIGYVFLSSGMTGY